MKQFTRLFYSADTAGPVAPLEQSGRIRIIDTVRGIALLGILMMNIPYFGMPHQDVFDLRVRDEFSGVNYYTWWTVNGMFEGTMRALFSMLFGAGCILILQNLEKKQAGLYAADIYYRRLIWLILFGMVNAFIFNWPGDILFNYGLCGLFLFPFRNMKAKGLLIMSIVILAISTVLTSVPMYMANNVRKEGEKALALEASKAKLTEEQVKAKESWEGMKKRTDINEVRTASARTKKEMQSGYLDVLTTLAPINIKFESIKLYKNYFWDAIAFFFVGMFFFRRRILTGERSLKFYWVMLVVGYGAGLLMNYFFLRTALRIGFDFTLLADEMLVNPYQLRRLLVTMGHLSLIMLLYKYRVVPWLMGALSKVGQMAFSNYLMQSIICTLIFYGYGLRWFGEFERYQLYIVMAGIWLFQIAFSNLWLQYFRFGPFEWLWRSLTYWKKQPMKRSRGREAIPPGTEPAPVVA
ncbi:MAG: hypothetical protein K0Q66_415 [Chitinophagaceae bacterium]|jgi:uncharacterized protein|nr:hypothetical protein [Chitinophagaceae bacterium]